MGEPLGRGGLDRAAATLPVGFFLLSLKSRWISSMVRRSRLRVPNGIIDSVSDALNLAAARVELTFSVSVFAAMPCGRGAESGGITELVPGYAWPVRLETPPCKASSCCCCVASKVVLVFSLSLSVSESDDDDDDEEPPELEDDESSSELTCSALSGACASCRGSAIRRP